MPGARWNTVPWMSWSPVGRPPRLLRPHREAAHADRPERGDRQDRAAGRAEDGRRARVARLLARRPAAWRSRRCRARSATSSSLDLETEELHEPHEGRVRRLRARPSRPTASSLVYIARISGNDKLFRLDLATKKKTQLTFGTHDDAAAQFLDDDTLVFSSTATDPAKPVEPEVARNGNIYNIWTLEPEDRRAAAVHRRARRQRVAGRRCKDGDADEDRLRHLLQGRVRAAHARAEGAGRDGGLDATSARPGPSSTSRRRSRTRWSPTNQQQEGHVREDVPRGPPAGERRRHERRRRLRRHAGHLRRRARRPAVQRLRRVGLAVPDVRRART